MSVSGTPLNVRTLFPLSFPARTTHPRTLLVSVVLGIGFLITADREFEATSNGETETGAVDIIDEINGLDIGLNVGIGYKLEKGIFIGARYNWGLSNINDIEGADDIKNQNRVTYIWYY